MRIREFSSGIFQIKDKASFIRYSEGRFCLLIYLFIFIMYSEGMFCILFIYLFVHLFDRSFVHLVVRLFIWSFGWLVSSGIQKAGLAYLLIDLIELID